MKWIFLDVALVVFGGMAVFILFFTKWIWSKPDGPGYIIPETGNLFQGILAVLAGANTLRRDN